MARLHALCDLSKRPFPVCMCLTHVTYALRKEIGLLRVPSPRVGAV